MKEITIVELTTRKEILYDNREYMSYVHHKQPLYYGNEGVIPYSKGSEYQRELITVPIHRFCRSFGSKDGDITPWEVRHEEEFISYSPDVWKCLTTFRDSVENQLKHEKNTAKRIEKSLQEELVVEKHFHNLAKENFKELADKINNMSIWGRVKYLFTGRIY